MESIVALLSAAIGFMNVPMSWPAFAIVIASSFVRFWLITYIKSNQMARNHHMTANSRLGLLLKFYLYPISSLVGIFILFFFGNDIYYIIVMSFVFTIWTIGVIFYFVNEFRRFYPNIRIHYFRFVVYGVGQLFF